MVRRSMGSEQFLGLGVVPHILMLTILICHRLARQQHRGNRRCAGNTLHWSRPCCGDWRGGGAVIVGSDLDENSLRNEAHHHRSL